MSILSPSTEPSAPRGAYTIAAFAKAHGISESMFYKLKKKGLGPTTMAVGTRKLISIEAAAAWRREREAATVSVEA
jgi:hypothetical protein